MNAAELTGRARTHVAAVPEGGADLHVLSIPAFLSLRNEALAHGFDLRALSGFRDFDRQLSIWNGKFEGLRPTYDAAGRPIDMRLLEAAERVAAILHWSALPGASRHHWGTDVDLIDARAVGAAYRVQLTADEYAAGGPFHALGCWLDANAVRFGFFRPYRGIRSGVRPEPWHYSFAPLSEAARRELKVEVLAEAVTSAPLCGKAEVLACLDALHARYVDAIDPP